MLDVLGLDIGGANLKAAHTQGMAHSRSFAMWKDPAGLADALRGTVRELPPAGRWAVTMTGELCDCFASKREGVQTILDAVAAVAAAIPVLVWQTNGSFVDLATARATPHLTASANWLGLATFAGRYLLSGPALVIDIGSTTTDIIPVLDGRPVPRGRTDPERLRCRELVYTGVRRTPVCALLGGDGAAEFFATSQDVYLVLGELPEAPADLDTADGRPATRPLAQARLARMLCADLETSTETQRLHLARDVRSRQVRLLQDALNTVIGTLAASPQGVILSGAGEFLARSLFVRPTELRILSLAEMLGPGLSEAACAYAVAVLAAEIVHAP